MNLEPGTRVDRYILVEPLGEGGQGAVWKARDPLNGDALVALKLMSVAGARTDMLERARREARALARLAHPSLVSCHGLFEDLKLDLLGYSMELVDGVSLRSLSHDERLDSGHIAAVLGHVARVLGYLHQNGVFHRDIKLDNVVVRHNFWEQPNDPTSVKVVDLGIARVTSDAQGLTQMGTVVGTISYLAPEILDPASVEGDVPESARDVFAFGVTGWLLVTGRHPTGLPASAKIADYVRAYRAGREDASRYPEPTPSDDISRILADALAVDHQKRIADGVALSERWSEVSDVAVVVHSQRSKVDAAAPTALFGATEAAAVADMKEAPKPASSGGKRGIVYLVLAGAVAAGVYAAMKPETRTSPPIAFSLPSLPSASAKRLPPAPSALPSASDSSDAALAMTECDAASVCDCCPSGQACGGESCDELLSEAEFKVRAGEVRIAGGDASILTTHPTAEVCLNIVGREQPPECSALSAIKSDKPPTGGLYANVVDLVDKGIDIEVRVPVESGNLPVAWKKGVKQSGGISRRMLCEGIVVTELTTHVASYEVVLYLDPDGQRVPRPCR